MAVRGNDRSNPGLWIFLLQALRGPDRHSSTTYALAEIVDFKMHSR